MKFLHCADLHLDAKMDTHLGQARAKERRGEILHTFERMVGYARENGVGAVLIAGDMFDKNHISATVRNAVMRQICQNPQMRFYYLRGNHDADNFLFGLEELPPNLCLFSDHWTSYAEADGGIAITGMELREGQEAGARGSLLLDPQKFNIVMLHGQETAGMANDQAAAIPLKELRNRGIDYLALGHIHAYKKERLDARGTYCYPGCLEGRGFDECGEHGFVLLDVDERAGTYTHTFVPFAYRTLYAVEVAVSGCQSTAEMVQRVEAAIQKEHCAPSALIKIVLKGALDVECEKDLSYLQSCFAQHFYFAKVQDETTRKIDPEQYRLDTSLKGEYVRQVLADGALSEEDRAAILHYGLRAIAGEEVLDS